MDAGENREDRVDFRPIDIESDVHLMYAWLTDPDVAQWYDEGEHSVANYRRRFAPERTTHKFIIQIDGEAAGYLQAYRLTDEPEYQAQMGVYPDAGAIDLMLGPAHLRGKGWGPVVLVAAQRRIIFGELDCDLAMIAPDPANARAVRAYEKAGYAGDRTVWVEDDEPGNTGWERIMLQTREEFLVRFGGEISPR